MTNNEKRAHDIAIVTTKMIIDSDLPKYKVTGPEALIEDFTLRYDSAYNQSLELLNGLKPNKWSKDERWD